jgi:hypothetical protein
MGSQVGPERKPGGELRFRLREEMAQAWPSLGSYQRLEQAVAVVLSFLISCVIVAATAHLILVEARDFFLKSSLIRRRCYSVHPFNRVVTQAARRAWGSACQHHGHLLRRNLPKRRDAITESQAAALKN